ncbi:hypothetical protein V1288_003330 [Bradyrhizobium sp. AZCC 2176]
MRRGTGRVPTVMPGLDPGIHQLGDGLPVKPVKPGNDELGCRQHQFCSLTPSITTVDAVLFPGKFESSQSRRSVPLSQTLRFIL